MESNEATALRMRSFPAHVIKSYSNETVFATNKLLKELSNLPHAIAQAAANILD
jgi:hypothetical protein